MVAIKSEVLANENPPKTRLRVVKGVHSTSLPEPPISPATPLKSKHGNLWWQLQFDFTQPLPPLPAIRKRGRKTRKASPANAKPPRIVPTLQEEEARIQKGIRDREQFMGMIGNPAKYKEMLRIARGEINKSLNRSDTLKGLQPWDEEQIFMDHFHDTILKVSQKLEAGRFKSEVGGGNLMGYFYTFLKMDARRYVRGMDAANKARLVLDDDEDSDDPDHRSSMVGQLAGMLSENPHLMEGSHDNFAEFLHDYVFEFVLREFGDTERDLLDADFFRRYYGTKCKIKDISQSTGYNNFRVNTGYKRALAFVRDNIDIAALEEAFGRRIMSGCNC
jgi:hypothetical protein